MLDWMDKFGATKNDVLFSIDSGSLFDVPVPILLFAASSFPFPLLCSFIHTYFLFTFLKVRHRKK